MMEVDKFVSVALMVVLFVFYLTFLCLHWMRRKERPIIGRSPRLIMLNSIGILPITSANLVLSLFLLSQKAISLVNNPSASRWICNVQGGLNLFNLPLLYYPYILR